MHQPEQGGEESEPLRSKAMVVIVAGSGPDHGWGLQGGDDQQVEKPAGSEVNTNVDQVVAPNIVAAQQVVEGKADIGHRPGGGTGGKGCLLDRLPVKSGDPDMGIVVDPRVVKNELAVQRVPIGQAHGQGEQSKA